MVAWTRSGIFKNIFKILYTNIINMVFGDRYCC